MLKFVCMILLVFSSAGLLAQNVRMIFSWTGALAENGSVTVRAVNLTTNDTLLFPGRDTLILTTIPSPSLFMKSVSAGLPRKSISVLVAILSLRRIIT